MSYFAKNFSLFLKKVTKITHVSERMSPFGLGKPGVTGVAFEHPLEGVADGSAGSPTFSVTFRLTKQKSGGGLPHQKFVYYHPTSTGSRTSCLQAVFLYLKAIEKPIASYGNTAFFVL